MKVKSTTKMKFRRSYERKTNYSKRIALLKSKKPRLVIRKTNTKIITQIIKDEENGDTTNVCALSTELKKFGWKYGTKNIPACYLTGYLCGIRAIKNKIDGVIVDIGLHTPVHGSRIFAVVKGALDAGLKIKVGEVALPKEERIKGHHINKEIESQLEILKKKIIEEMK
ncbi:MAG: 50S ribosomal protein L18 [Candidatus Diapherotrites archaeon]|nr:50S ribosomal protein L18 [Candidatus Diapherotrites archaeon]